MMKDTCVCCGEYVPEGRHVCFKCENPKVKVHAEICETLNAIYSKKNHDYGDSFAKARLEIPCYTLGKLYDKFSRLKTLLDGADQRVNDESIEDTLVDLANYCIMELVERRFDHEAN